MRLSDLQKYIIKKSYESGKARTNRISLVKFYINQKNSPAVNLQTKIITQSIERLIDRGLMVGFGERTRCKWFIKEVKLTSAGQKLAKKLQGEQIELPFRKVKRKNK